MSGLEKWDKILTTLWRQSRFASYFYQAVSLVASERLPTLALAVANHRFTLFYNRDFVLDTPADQLIGLLIHEMLHVVLNHEHRARPGQDIRLCNLAQDMVINSYLAAREKTFFSVRTGTVSAPLVLPPGLPRIPAAFGKIPGRAGAFDLTWEEVYAWLKEQSGDPAGRRRDSHEADDRLPFGIDSWPDASPDRDRPAQPDGIRFVDGRGNTLPTGIHLFGDGDGDGRTRAGAERILGFIRQHDDCRGERLFADLCGLFERPAPPGNLQWKNAIRTMADQAVPTSRWEYSFSRPNRRFFDAGIYAPGRFTKSKPLITIVVDVSGSMAANPGDIAAAFGAVEELTADYRINLLCIDQDLFLPRGRERAHVVGNGQGVCLYQPGDWRYIKTGSRGATFFAPLFNAYMKHHTEALIVITDGEIYDLDALHPYDPTLWIVSGNRTGSFSPPFGRVMSIEDESNRIRPTG